MADQTMTMEIVVKCQSCGAKLVIPSHLSALWRIYLDIPEELERRGWSTRRRYTKEKLIDDLPCCPACTQKSVGD